MDGGQVALIGFLYQMMGALGLRAWAVCRTIPVENADMEALLGVIHDGDVYHETHDTDALAHRLGLDQPGASVLIQFKYSQNPERSPLTPTDLKYICENFKRSIRQWPSGEENTTYYRVITNRPISRTLRPVMHKPTGQRSHAVFQQPELHEMLQVTEIFERLDFSLWNEALRHFACEYGVTQDEYERGISTLVGMLVERAAIRQALPLGEAELIKAFCGYEGLQKLTFPSIRERTESDWEEQRNRLGVYEVPVRRRLLAEAMDRVKRSAFVIFTGHGGSGKSVAAWHLSRLMLQGSAESPGSLAVFLPAWDVQPQTLSWVVGGWSGIPVDRRTEPPEKALERLRIANPLTRPVLCMVLDGLDERRMTEGRDTNIRDLVGWFWRQEQLLRRNSSAIDTPIATLIVTCREPGIVKNDWLVEAFSPVIPEYPPITPVAVEDYSPQELLDAVQQDLPLHVERFEQWLSPQAAPSMSVGIVDAAFAPVPKEVLEALTHPAMWYALRRLQPEEHVSLLDGNIQALDLLAEHFLTWFYEKAWRRHPQWNREDVAETLAAIALRAFATHAAQYPLEDRYTFDIYLGSNIAPSCNDSRVPLNLIQWLELHSQNSEKDADRRRLLYLRLADCVRPRQVEGMSSTIPPKSLALIQLDARRNSRNTSLWSTWESNLKQQAWTTLLLLGHPSTLSISQFNKAIVQEDSGFLKGKLMELLACFRWKHLPDQVLTWITEKVDVKRETAPQELPFRRGAESLARSAGTRQAFDALLASGTTFDGALLRETANALASLSVTLARQGDSEIIEKLLETIEHGKEEGHRRAAIEALVWIASADLFPVRYLSRIVALIEDETREVLERSNIVHILGAIPREHVAPGMVGLLQQLVHSQQAAIASSALEALTQNGAVLDTPELLEERLSFTRVNERWTSQFSPHTTNWMVGMVVTLYRLDPERLALVMASLIEGISAFMLPLVLRALDEIHRVESRSLPVEVRRALLAQLDSMRDVLFTTPTELLEICAKLLPDAFGERVWEPQWGAWTPETRAALAQALGHGKYMTERAQERAIEHLLLLMRDAQYRVRRQAYRSLATVAPDILLCITAAWAHAPIMELRRRAAEALNWLAPGTDFDLVANDLKRVLASDPDLLVREALIRSNAERRQRVWANEYLLRMRQAYRKNNKVRLSAWRYAHALRLTGDDAIIDELEADLAKERLALHERQWVIWALNNMKESWKKTEDKWPKPWSAWRGRMIYQRGQINVASVPTLSGKFLLYQETDEISRPNNWRGIFAPDLSNTTPDGELLTFTLADGLGGQLTLAGLVGDMWLVERAALEMK